jgi:hypothetical protein
VESIIGWNDHNRDRRPEENSRQTDSYRQAYGRDTCGGRACENWARSLDLDIFNDLLQPFQTHPPIPVHQATIQQPVHQAQQPVHQAQVPVHQATLPEHDLPALSTDILNHTLRELDICMSPGQPQASRPPAPQPTEYNAEMSEELRQLRAEMEQMRLAREKNSLELRRLWDTNQSNEQALKRAEIAYNEELRRRQALEATFAQTTVANPPAQPRPQPATHPHFQVPQWPAPDNPNTNLLTELARLQTLFAANQHAVNEQLLNGLTQNTGRQLPALKASDIGLFEPVAQPDAAAAILFIDNFNDAVKQYGEDRVLLIMKRCCNNAVALSWLTSLSEDDRNGLIISIAEWERLLRRDFMPKLADLETRARDETFKWSQNRTPTQYISDKIKLLKIAGITHPDKVVYELHRGFHRCPELQIPLTQAVKETGNDLAHYRRQVLN